MNKFTPVTKRKLRKASSKGGKKAAANMTPEERKARAKNAVAARELKRKGLTLDNSGV
jgi:hypothetical protein